MKFSMFDTVTNLFFDSSKLAIITIASNHSILLRAENTSLPMAKPIVTPGALNLIKLL